MPRNENPTDPDYFLHAQLRVQEPFDTTDLEPRAPTAVKIPPVKVPLVRSCELDSVGSRGGCSESGAWNLDLYLKCVH